MCMHMHMLHMLHMHMCMHMHMLHMHMCMHMYICMCHGVGSVRARNIQGASIRNLAWCHAGHGLDVVRLLRLRVVSQADSVDTCGIEAQD